MWHIAKVLNMVPKTPFLLLLFLLELYSYGHEFCILNINEEKQHQTMITCKFILFAKYNSIKTICMCCHPAC